MKVGDYVRTNNGCICKVLKYTDISDNDFYVNTDSQYNVIYRSWIVKSSPNIIDLIEVGDYVNGEKVIRLFNPMFLSMGELPYVITDKNNYEPQEIKSIVTCEQFSQMEYKVGE